MKKQLLLFFLMLLPMAANADYSGTCGDNLTWTYVESIKTLTISGTGQMKNYNSSSSLPWYSFRSSIQKVIIHDGVTSIGSDAFYYCSSLTSVTIPNSVTSIGNCAFYECSGLTSVNIPNSVTSIGGMAFYNCSGLTSVNIPNSVTSIGDYTFYNCSGLTSVNIGNSVTSIGEYAFCGCSGLTSVTIPNSVTSIGNSAFSGCSGLTSVTISNSVTSIGNSAFRGCRGLTSVTIPNSVTSIGGSAFYGCSGLTDVYSLIEEPFVISNSVFQNRVNNSYVFTNATLHVPAGTKAKYESTDGWKEFKKIVEIALSSKDIAFADANVKALCVANWDTGGDGELSYEEAAAVTDLGDVFKNNTSIVSFEELQYFTGLTAIGVAAFQRCSSLTGISIPNSVTTIGRNAFENCTSLNSVNIPCSVTTLESSLFSRCKNLNKIVLPNSITQIPSSMMFDSNGVGYIHVPGSVRWIGRYAISECDTVVIEDGSTTLTLQDRNADDGYYDGVLKDAKELYVGRNTVCEGYYTAGEVFNISGTSYTQLTNVTFGPLVTNAFTGYEFRCCDKVKSVTCLAKEPFLSPNFYTIPQTAVLNVPLGSKQNYESAKGWSDFNNIQEVTEVTITLDDTEMVYAGDFDLDFSQVTGLQAFTAGNLDADASTIAFDCVQTVPAGKGVILRGAKGTYTVPCANIELMLADPLCGTISGRFIRRTQDDKVNYYFDKVEHVFKPIDSVYGCQLSRNEAYLSLPASSISGDGSITPRYVKKQNEQKLELAAIPELFYGNANYTLPTTTAENQVLTWASGNTSIATIRGNILTIVGAGTTTITATQAGNDEYKPFSREFPLKVNKAKLTITANDCSKQEGDANPELTVSYSGFKNDDNVSSLKTQPTINTPATTDSPAGIYPITASNAASDNYEITYVSGTLTVTQKPIVHDILAIIDTEGLKGTKVTLEVTLTNEDEVKLCQFDLRLPAGVTVATKSNGKLDATLTKRAESHSVSGKQLANGDYRFVISSLDNDSFTGNSGTLLEITLEIPATMVAGEYIVKVLNGELSVPAEGNNLKVVKPKDTDSKLMIKSYTPGDVNNDGSVSVTDVGCAINYILEMMPTVFIFEAADMNGDKSISVTDVGMIINLILNEGAASRQVERPAIEEAQLSLQPTADGYELGLENKDAFIGFQFDVQLSDGATLKDIKLTGSDDHLLTYRHLSNGSYRVVCYSPMNSTFTGNDAALLNISTTGDMAISNIRLTTANLSEVIPADMRATTTGISEMTGVIHQSSELKIYTLDGRLCRTISVQPGENPLKGLKAGIYMIGNRKVVVR